MKKPRVYIDLDDTMCHFRKRWHEVKSAEDIAYPQSKKDFFLNLEPIDGAIETYNWLDENFDVWILTAPSVLNPLCYTEKRLWVEKHLGIERCHKLLIVPDKSLCKGDYLIDDTSSKGQLEFEGKFIHFGKKDFETWSKVKKYFESVLKANELSNSLRKLSNYFLIGVILAYIIYSYVN